MARAKPDPTDPTDPAVSPLDPAIAADAPAPAESAAPVDPVVAAAPRVVPVLRVTAAADSRWRGGLQFGRAVREIDEDEARAAAEARGMSPEAWLALLTADPVLAVVPGFRTIAD